ncbi:MAG: signal peptide peptidase SppA [Tannerellaceae bacterium]|jgi:protease-4|nr:signal peptide peptidase SppA [Tannerellaceae bacterium]
MKQFFKMMFASTLAVLVATGIIISIGLFVFIGIVASVGSQPSYTPPSNTVFKLSLSGSMTDIAEDNPLLALMGETVSQMSLEDVVKSIRAAKNNPNINGIYIESGVFYTGTANIDVIRRELLAFKESGKFIVAYADLGYTQGAYYLCSVADKVFMNPEAVVEISGMATQTTFYKALLDKIGVEMQIFKVGTYKSYVEPFMLDKLSDENREQLTSYLGSIWKNISNGIAESRNISVDDINRFADKGLFISPAKTAVEYKLVDELNYKSEVEEYVMELAGQKGDKLETAGINKLKNIKEKANNHANQIAVLYAEGEIQAEVASYSSTKTITEKLTAELIKLRKNKDIKAVVLRVNSPGGSAFVSEQIWHEIMKLKEEKPIVVSMGSVAASGGYYISCAANKIIAEKNTVTGSIGVFGMFPNASGLYKKLDVTTDVVKTNHFGDFGDLSRPMREDEKALMQSFVERSYDTFLTRCADGRGMTKEAIDKVGQGRVWTGEQALENGLVDELGGLDKALEVAAGLANIDQYKVVNVYGSNDFFTDFLEKQLNELKLSIVKNMLGEEFEHYKKLNEIRSSTGILARLPFDIEPL